MSNSKQAVQQRPNVVLILADDMGFSDLGVTGSEIRTPNLDKLAQDGALLTSMVNCARCCPTRASLLTGMHPHSAGIGHMGANLGTAAYQGYLREDSATIAEVMRVNGYRTLMAGKWHVGGDLEARNAACWEVGTRQHPTPCQRGFDQFYGILDGASHFFSPHCVFENDTKIEITKDDYYFTDAITKKAISMVESSVAAEMPFFLYLAHTAPHWPLHAPEETIARYEGVYDKGWDATRTARHETLNGNRVLKANWDISARDPDVPAWQHTRHKAWESEKMSAYAAMVDRMDQTIGSLIHSLKRLGEYENTLILFLSDNGGCAEFMAEDGWAQYYPDTTRDGRKITMGNVPGVTPGNAQTFQSYDKPWANVSNAPFRMFKHFVHEGGIATPFIAHWPNAIKPATVGHEPCHVMDILPTILQATGGSALNEVNDQSALPLQGESFLDLLQGRSWSRQQPILLEHEGNSAIRFNNFKLVRRYARDWELYDMDADRTELTNIARKNLPLVNELIIEFEAWAANTGVVSWEVLLPKLLAAWQLDSVNG